MKKQTKKNKYVFVAFKDGRKWYWNIHHRNKKVIAYGGEGYNTKCGMMKSVIRLFEALQAKESTAIWNFVSK